MRRSKDRRWNSRFAQFVLSFGVKSLAGHLGIHTSAIYHWTRGKCAPSPSHALEIQRLAAGHKVPVSLEQIYAHFQSRGKRWQKPSAKNA